MNKIALARERYEIAKAHYRNRRHLTKIRLANAHERITEYNVKFGQIAKDTEAEFSSKLVNTQVQCELLSIKINSTNDWVECQPDDICHNTNCHEEYNFIEFVNWLTSHGLCRACYQGLLQGKEIRFTSCYETDEELEYYDDMRDEDMGIDFQQLMIEICSGLNKARLNYKQYYENVKIGLIDKGIQPTDSNIKFYGQYALGKLQKAIDYELNRLADARRAY